MPGATSISTPDAREVIVAPVEDGFFAAAAPTGQTSLVFRVVPNLPEAVQYFRYSVSTRPATELDVWMVMTRSLSAVPASAGTTSEKLDALEGALRSIVPDALLCFCVEDWVGYERVVAPALHGVAVAAAAAAMKYGAAWDDSDPIRIVVAPDSYEVSVAYVGAVYRASVRREAHP